MHRNNNQNQEGNASNLKKVKTNVKNSCLGEEMDQNTRWQIFSCRNPRNSNMCRFNDRLGTYDNWPSHRTKATPTELAQAGFIYMGEYDRLKCFYCNGGLQNWTYDEDPWFEHAKWYPNCEYLLRVKGIRFVQQVSSFFPNLNRPIIEDISSKFERNSNPFPSNSSASYLNTLRSDGAANEVGHLPSTSSRTSESKDLKAKLNAAMESEIVTATLPFGFSEAMIENLVKRKLEKEDAEYESVMSLVKDLQIEETMQTKMATSSEETHHSMETSIVKSTQSVDDHWLCPAAQQLCVLTASANAMPTLSLEATARKKLLQKQTLFGSASDKSGRNFMFSKEINERLRYLMDEKTCKVCLDREINALFLPCGHLCCCVECASAIRNCPICRQKLNKIIKIYKP